MILIKGWMKISAIHKGCFENQKMNHGVIMIIGREGRHIYVTHIGLMRLVWTEWGMYVAL
ncbi:hypothetical protein HC62_01465 [Acetobacter tropicalis]|jgi:hypothetical protein|uniref:Uncharacterized protein n=1 Tax=Acetobacter tropicalis TaxID=104102 RepID=A0A252ABX8_9PROT|nr:hypothetical protein HC62_01465 [Acetobacter tropicalis]